MSTIYIVEDDSRISEALASLLSQYAYTPIVCTDFSHVTEDILTQHPDLVLLDVMLPGKDGYTICQELRSRSDTPVIMLTGQTSEMEEVMSLKCGADDFVGKPYHPQVLMAHIEAVLKRAGNAAQKSTLTVEGLTLDVLAGTLSFGDKQIELHKNELRILHLLMGQHGQIVSREEIMEELWQDGQFVDENTLNVNMVRLRKQLKELGCENLLKTKRGMGYLL